MTSDLDKRVAILIAMDVAAGRQADALRGRSLAFALADLPLQWLEHAARRIARSKTSRDFPATAAEVYREAWRAAGFTHVYNPRLEGAAAYREPQLGDVRWWPVAPLAGEWLRLASRWEASPQALELPASGYMLPVGARDPVELPALARGGEPTLLLSELVDTAVPRSATTPPKHPKPRQYDSGAEFLREWEAKP